MLDLQGRQGFSKRVGNHVASWAKNKKEFAILDDPADKVETDVDVFSSGVILVILHESNCRLVIRK
jgi:hypothetical protein